MPFEHDARPPGTRARKRLWVAADCPPGVPAIKPCERGALIGLDMARTRPDAHSARRRAASISATCRLPAAGCSSATARTAGIPPSCSNEQRGYGGQASGRTARAGRGRRSTADGKQLVVADYSQGIGIVADLATFKRTISFRARTASRCAGIDGLVRCGATYYGIYNGAAPGLLVSITTRPTAASNSVSRSAM